MLKNKVSRQYWIGVPIGTLIVALYAIAVNVPFIKTQRLMLLLLFSILGGASAGFVVGKGAVGGLIAGFLAGFVGGTIVGVVSAISTLVRDFPIGLGNLIGGALDLAFLNAMPAIIGGLLGAGVRKILKDIRGATKS